MNLRDTPEEAAFRAELRAWLDANLPEERRGWRGGAQRFDDSFGREWSAKLRAERGLFRRVAEVHRPRAYPAAGAGTRSRVRTMSRRRTGRRLTTATVSATPIHCVQPSELEKT